METLVIALDNYTPKQFGEKGHIEYSWSNSLSEQIVQFDFQLVRCDNTQLQILDEKLHNLLMSLMSFKNEVDENKKEIKLYYLSLLYRIIGSTRDITEGKGENNLTYMMIYRWYNDVNTQLAYFALKCLINLCKSKEHPYGSWKDMKYFCNYVKSKESTHSHPLIDYCVHLINENLHVDEIDNITKTTGKNLSLVAKWIPREKSKKFGWLFRKLALNYFSGFMLFAKTDEQICRAENKCKTYYRKLIANLNRSIETVQIKQCGKNWADINFDHVTSITFTKQKKAFMNKNNNGTTRSEEEDRILCAKNFSKHIEKAVRGEKQVKGKRVGMVSFTKQALDIINLTDNSDNHFEKELLNSQWRDNSTQTNSLGKMIPMVDVSGSMEGQPLHAAVALGIRIAEKSLIGKRIMTFSAIPKWLNLDGYDGFVSMVSALVKADWGMNTNFYAAMKMILDAIIQNKMTTEDVQDMVLVVLSDMQIDQSFDSKNKEKLFESIKIMYEEAGFRLHGIPFKAPHILFWNLRTTSGFPSLSNDGNCSMLSGFSASLLNLFCDKGIVALESLSPLKLLEQKLENERYKIMKTKFEEIM